MRTVPIPGYEELYEITEDGRVWSITNGIWLKNTCNKHTHGYVKVQLCKDGSTKVFRVHRLVACCFIENPDELPQVNHIDENKQNNHYTNLEWCDNEYNSKKFAENNPTVARSSNKPKEVIVNGTTYPSLSAAARFISEDSGRGKVDTIRREIQRRHLHDGDSWVMYGEYLIGG
jgi:hypothetical protein